MPDRSTSDLSIVIVNYNGAKLLAQCLDSVFKTKGDLELEIYVVDNGSTDGSIAMLRDDYPGVHTIANKDNLGFAKANNQALPLCEGRYSLLLNNDTIVLERALQTMIQCLDHNPHLGGVGPQLLGADGTIQRPGLRFYSLLRSIGNFCQRRLGWQRKYVAPVAGQYAFVEAVWGACLMVRGKAIQEVGLLDEGFFIYGEEVDWCYRAGRRGWGIAYLPESQVIHLGGQTSRRDPDRFYVERLLAHLRFILKHRARCTARIWALLMGLRLCARWVFHKQERAPWQWVLRRYTQRVRALFASIPLE